MTPAQSLKKTKAVDKKNTKSVISVVMFLRADFAALLAGVASLTLHRAVQIEKTQWKSCLCLN